jgi:hypothetical protein
MNTQELFKSAGSVKENALFLPKMLGATAGGRIAGTLGGGLAGGALGGLGGIAYRGITGEDVNPEGSAVLGALGGAGLGSLGGSLVGHGLGVKWNKYPVTLRNYLVPMAGSVPGAVAATIGGETGNAPLLAGGAAAALLGMLASKKFMKR